MLLLIVLLTCSMSFAAEKTSVIPSVGTLVFHPEIEVLPLQIPSNKLVGNTLLAKDTQAWRSINIYFAPIPDANRSKIKANFDYYLLKFTGFNTLINSETSSRVLLYKPLNPLALDNEQSAVASLTYLTVGVVMHMDFYIINGSDGLAAMTTLYTDGDSNYWTPRISEMIANIQR